MEERENKAQKQLLGAKNNFFDPNTCGKSLLAAILFTL